MKFPTRRPIDLNAQLTPMGERRLQVRFPSCQPPNRDEQLLESLVACLEPPSIGDFRTASRASAVS
jgi:hypothetical protein